MTCAVTTCVIPMATRYAEHIGMVTSVTLSAKEMAAATISVTKMAIKFAWTTGMENPVLRTVNQILARNVTSMVQRSAYRGGTGKIVVSTVWVLLMV